MIKALCSRAIICLLMALLLTVLIVPQSLAAESAAVTRRDFVIAINEAFGFDGGTGNEEVFTDIPVGSPDYSEFAAARRAGYLAGYPDGSAGPDNAVTRAEAAAILDRILEITVAEINMSFSDDSLIPEWAIEGARDTVASGILLLNETGAFRPADTLTAAELDNIIDAVNTSFTPAYEVKPKLGVYGINTESISVEITNMSDEEGGYGRYYRIEQKAGDEWTPLPLDIIVTEEWFTLSAGETREHSYSLHRDEYDYSPEVTYRIVLTGIAGEPKVVFQLEE